MNKLTTLHRSSLFDRTRFELATVTIAASQIRHRLLRTALEVMFLVGAARIGSIVQHRAACRGNAGYLLTSSHRRAVQYAPWAHAGSLRAQRRLWFLESRGVVRYNTVVRVFVPDLVCPSSHAPVSFEGENYHFLNSLPLSIPRCADSDGVRGFATFVSRHAQAWSKVNWLLH